MLVKSVTSALRQLFAFTCVSMMLSIQAFASTWVYIPDGILIPLPNFSGVEVQDHYTNGVVTADLKNVGQSSVVYFQPQLWQNGAFDDTAPWQCDDQPSLNGDDWTVTINNLAEGMYRIKAAVSMAQSNCQISEFEADKLIASERLVSTPFMLANNVDIALSTLEQERQDRYHMVAYWPPVANADNYKLGISKDNVWHYFDVSAAQYDADMINDGGRRILDTFDNTTRKYSDYTGFGNYKMSVSYCFDGLCSSPMSNPTTTLTVLPTTDFTLLSAYAVADQYAANIQFQTDSRTPKFEIYRFVEFPNTDQPFIAGVLPINLPDAQTTNTITNNGLHAQYDRVVPLNYAGRYELRVRPCTNEGACNDWVYLGPFFNVASSQIKIVGGFDSFNPQIDRVTGWVSDTDQHPEKVRLYYNGNYIEGTETATTTGSDVTKRYFSINDIDSLFTNAGINTNEAFSVELRALDWPSTTLYRTVETLHVNHFFNSSPIANADAVFALGDEPIHINVLANDIDPDNNQLKLNSYDLLSSAGVTVSNFHDYIVYTPDSSLGIDVDTLVYRNEDEHGQWSNETTVSVIYSSVMAIEDEAELASSASTSGSKFDRNAVSYSADIDVLANDQNLQNLPVTVEIVTPPAQGSVTVDSNNIVKVSIVGQPTGPICVEYQILTEAGSRSNVASACGYSNDYFPKPDTFAVAMNSTSHLDVIENDQFSTLKRHIEITANTTGTLGTVTVFRNARDYEMVRYSAPANFIGTDTFTYSVTGYDGNLTEGPIPVTVIVGDVTPSAPSGLTATVISDTSIQVNFNGVTGSTSYQLQQFMSQTDIASNNISENSWSPVTPNDPIQRYYTINDLSSGYYYYRARACSNFSYTCSDWSLLSSSTHLSGSGTGGDGDTGGGDTGGGNDDPIVQPDTESSPDISWPAGQDKVSAAVGTLAGSFRVSESGSATYQVPVTLLEGIAGVTPTVSLNYNSSSGNSIMGMGWQLSANNAITRCRQTFETDGRYQEIMLNNTDRFCFNGQKLIPVTGSNGGAGTIYRTEIDNQQRITSYGSAGNGPAYFTVESPDGSISYYGDTVDYTHTTGTVKSGSTVVTWLQVKSIDNMGQINTSNINTIDYYYEHLADNEVVLDYINYSENQVDFSYSSRNDTSFAYAAGLVLAKSQRLDTITVKNHNGTAVNSYHLDYTPISGAPNDITRLRSITQCNGNNNSENVCKLPTVFDWNDNYSNTNLHSTTSLNVATLSGTFPLDINGNGKVDFAILNKHSSDSYTLKFFMNTGNIVYSTIGAPSSISLSHGDTANSPTITPVDVNGDGISELAIRHRSKLDNKFYWNLYTLESNGSSYKSTNLSDSIFGSFADLTGDGLVDFIYRDKVNGVFENMISINNGDGFNPGIVMPTPDLPASATQVSTDFDIKSLNLKPKRDGEFKAIAEGSVEEAEIESGRYVGTMNSDFNGDGLADIVHTAHYVQQIGAQGEPECLQDSYIRRYHIYTSEQTINAQSVNEFAFNYYGTLPEEDWIIDSYPADSSAAKEVHTRCDTADFNGGVFKGGQRVVDLNGDGMSDLLYRDSATGVWYVSYSTGAGFSTPVSPANMTGDIVNINYVDYDADGDVDVLYTIKPDSENTTPEEETHYWYRHENEGGLLQSRTSVVEFPNHLNFNAREVSQMYMDINGDGESERVTIDYKNEQMKIMQLYSTSRNNRIEKITDGLDNETIITYKPLTDDTVYTRAYDADTLDYGRGSPVLDIINSMHVVSEVTSSAPSYDSTGSIYNENATVSVKYAYEGLKVQTGGRGFLGFKTLVTYDPQSGVTTESNYRQDFPYVGLASRTVQCLGAGLSNCNGTSKPLSISLSYYNDSASAEPNTLFDSKVYLVYPYRQLTDNYTLNSDGTTSFVNRSEEYTLKSVVSSGNYAQVDTTRKYVYATDNSSVAPISSTTTNNSYNSDNEDNWWINRLTGTQVIQGRIGEPDAIRNASFEYDSATGLLVEEYLEPNSSDESLYLKTVHTYDQTYGNKLTTTQCSLSNATASGCAKGSSALKQVYRHSSNVYYDNNRYINHKGNDLFSNVETLVGFDDLGLVTQSRDINGVESYAIYDSFGQPFASKDDAGKFKKITNRLKANKPAHWPIVEEPYSIVSQVIEAGKPVSYTYTNQQGLNVAEVTQGFADNTWIFQYNRFDKKGNVVKRSLPFYFGSSIYWATNQYDALKRPVSSTTADGNSTTLVTYADLMTSTIKSSSSANYDTIVENSSKTVNRLGEIVSTTDNLTNTVSYVYDATGKLKSTTTHGITTSLINDSYGRKTQMSDPNVGVLKYQYNALGELVEQTDAVGHTTRIYRDSLGRISREYIVKKDSNGNDVFVDQVNSVYSGHLLVEQNRNSNGYRQCHYYDSYGRNTQVTSILDNPNRSCPSVAPTSSITMEMYNQSTSFDGVGRVLTQYDASGKGVTNHYQNGYLHQQVEASNSSLLMEILAIDALGNVTRSKDGLNVETSKVFNPANGMIQSLVSDSGGLQHITYDFDGVGNMRNRNNINSNINQDFEYDSLNRLTEVDGFMLQSIDYDDNGNILSKSDVRNGDSYSYNSSRPHAVSSVGSMDYTYDNNGNQTRAEDDAGYVRKIDYSYFDKPTAITMGDNADADYTSFAYDSSNNRYKRVDVITNADNVKETTTTYYIGNVEVSQGSSGTVFVKRYIANAIQKVGNNGSNSTRYVYTDHLGSIDAIVTAQKHIETKLYFDPWGKRTALSKGQLSAAAQSRSLPTLVDSIGVTTRGFTGHESIDHTGIIHMNGRIYDASLGRFLQADPFVQEPHNTQSYNRYSYVFNNPLIYTDPSGYISWSFIRDTYLKPLVAIAITIYTGGLAAATSGWAGLGIAMAGGALAGAITTGTLDGALMGALSAAAFYGIGEAFQGIEKLNSTINANAILKGKKGLDLLENGLTAAQFAGKIAAHAMVGGIMSDLNGGKFGHGFFPAGVTQAMGLQLDKISDEGAQVFAAALIGGSVSKLTGGKFANGASTAVFSRVFNDLIHDLSKAADTMNEYAYAHNYVKSLDVTDPNDRLMLALIGSAANIVKSEKRFNDIAKNKTTAKSWKMYIFDKLRRQKIKQTSKQMHKAIHNFLGTLPQEIASGIACQGGFRNACALASYYFGDGVAGDQ